MTTTRFSGESDWDAIVNDKSMGIEEEDAFLEYCEENGIPFDLESLEVAYTPFYNAYCNQDEDPAP